EDEEDDQSGDLVWHNQKNMVVGDWPSTYVFQCDISGNVADIDLDESGTDLPPASRLGFMSTTDFPGSPDPQSCLFILNPAELADGQTYTFRIVATSGQGNPSPRAFTITRHGADG